MMNARKFGGGYCICSTSPLYEKGGKALTVLVSFIDSPKGGQRWLDKGVTPYG